MLIGGLLAFVLFLMGNEQGQRVETIALVDQWLAEASCFKVDGFPKSG